MADRTFTCLSCGATEETPGLTGRMPEYCEPCRRERKNARQRADRAKIRVANVACERCGGPIPEGSRADRKWCSSACQSYASRRMTGVVVENTGTCSSCGEPLTGMYANARACRKAMCRVWATRHPGVPHPTTQARQCDRCGVPIDHLNGKGKYCSRTCGQAGRRAANPDAANARARKWQSSDRGRAYRRAYQQVNVEERRRWAREARLRDPERYRDYWKQWAADNRAALREIEHLRRARLLGNPGSVGVSLRDWQWLVRHYRGCCAYCGDDSLPLHMDHVVPVAKGGRHAIGNVLPACSDCNLTKHAMLLVVWRYRRPKMKRICL